MRFEYECAVLLNYSPRGTSDMAVNSRTVKGRLKNGHVQTNEGISRIINTHPETEILRNFFDGNQCLVPVPRSAPLLKDALWPSRTICESFVSNGICEKFSPIIQRISPVPKSSQFYTAEDRPSILTQLTSLQVNPPPPDTQNFILIDDVLTLGRTTTACAHKIKEILPNSNVKIFCVMRTIGRQDDISKLLEPRTDFVFYNTDTGKSWIPNLDS